MKSFIPHREGEPTPLSSAIDDVRKGLDELLGRVELPFGGLGSRTGKSAPFVDVYQTEDALVVEAELPGVEPGDVEVTLRDGALVVTGEKRVTEGRRDVHVAERGFGTFRRAIPLSCEVDEERTDAAFKHGVLTVRMPIVHKSRNVAIRVDPGVAPPTPPPPAP